MTVFGNSRYRFGNTQQIMDKNGDVNAVHMLRDTTQDPVRGSKVYQLGAPDTLEFLAFKRYGDANKWYILADSNPQVFFPLDAVPGNEIVVPPKSVAAVK